MDELNARVEAILSLIEELAGHTHKYYSKRHFCFLQRSSSKTVNGIFDIIEKISNEMKQGGSNDPLCFWEKKKHFYFLS